MTGARDRLIQLYGAAIAGANVESLTADAVAALPLEGRRRVWLYAVGKAAHAMARGATGALQRGLAEIAGGVVVPPTPGAAPCGTVSVVVGDHPVPGPRSLEAANALKRSITLKRGSDLGIVLLSGGASSLIGAPLRGVEPADHVGMWQLVLDAGLDIARMNAVRKRFSYWAAGRMALGLAPAPTHCLVVSDVPGDDLAVVGSGPCVPDPTRADDVLAVLRDARLLDRLAPALRQYLVDVSRGAIPETPKDTHPAFAHMTARVIGGNGMAIDAATTAARRNGWHVDGHQALEGEAREAGTRIADQLIGARRNGGPRCVIWAGETTVTLPDGAPSGGRCQELALAAARRLDAAGDDAIGITLLAAGTDGRDGTTDAAGAFADASTWRRIAAHGVDPARALERHDAHAALGAAGALFSPGPTGTNVMDIVIGIIDDAR